jgi:hypothetical protein
VSTPSAPALPIDAHRCLAAGPGGGGRGGLDGRLVVRTCTGEDGSMGGQRWRAWVGAIVVALIVGAGGAAQAAGPQGNAPAASKEVEEAKRLEAEVERLNKEGRYDEALPLALRSLAIQEGCGSRREAGYAAASIFG